MDSRRDFIKKAALLSGGAGLWGSMPASVQRALAIDPAPGSTYRDAEHVVFLMQENRSFDHCFGTLRGVRGFNDPRAITLPNKNLVWLQSNKAGQTYAPFRLDFHNTRATWMSSLPHSWENQVDARNDGKYDKWLDVKRSGNKAYADMPLTLGYHNREDIPFYYAMADAFTICDQHFCSSLTGTTPNRLYFWSGTIREKQDGSTPAAVRNSEADYGAPASWTTFPERLEDLGVSWKVYQNEISMPTGLNGEEDSWLANFTDNPLEFFAQYHVGKSIRFITYLQRRIGELPAEIKALEQQEQTPKVKRELKYKQESLEQAKEYLAQWKVQSFDQLPAREQQLHQKAFTVNTGDPDYRHLTTLSYEEDGKARQLQVPKGDVLHQFREDVKTGKLPSVSWLVAPENFSDHPSAPWYGAWYVSEVLDILTQHPEVWKKTIFILNYDENDGWFDHAPPFVVPDPRREDTGKVSAGLDIRPDYVYLHEETEQKKLPAHEARESPIGLGYRVPLIIASPWSRGGWVNSQVFDLTSPIRFLEDWLSHKTGKQVFEPNISAWRRAMCGDLTSVFRPYNNEKIPAPAFPGKDTFLQTVYNARDKQVPTDFKLLTPAEIAKINEQPAGAAYMPQQEKGTRDSCALPYELYAEGRLSKDKQSFELSFRAGKELFGKQAAGAPFQVYAPGRFRKKDGSGFEAVRTWNYGVIAGDQLQDSYRLADFEEGKYHLRTYGPNGFFREYSGDANDPGLDIRCEYNRDAKRKDLATGHVTFHLHNQGSTAITVVTRDHYRQNKEIQRVLQPGGKATLALDLSKSFHWYDYSLQIKGHTHYERRYAGRVETGKHSQSDPGMGRVL